MINDKGADMTFFRILFTLLLVVPMAVFMIYLLNKMIDDLNTSVKNSRTEKKRTTERRTATAGQYGGYRTEVRSGRDSFFGMDERRSSERKKTGDGMHSGHSGTAKSDVKQLSKRKRRKQRKTKSKERRDRQQ